MDRFREIWCVDYEFHAPPGERPQPICMVAQEVRTGRTIRLWEDQLLGSTGPPFDVSDDSLFVAYYASAEMLCHLALEWPMPVCVLDLFTEFRTTTNGRRSPCGDGLLGALAYFGLDGATDAVKEEMRQLAIRGGPFSSVEREGLLDYCETDVVALGRLLPRMLPQLELDRALLRGRYMKAAAVMEHNGLPIDVDALTTLREEWNTIQEELIRELDADYGVYEGRSFKQSAWARFLAFRGIPWPVHESGRLKLDRDTFRQMARAYPEVAPIYELRESLASLRLERIAVGTDGRNRTMLSAFRARTGRNQPSNAKFIFGPATWIRGLIKPAPGTGVVYVDWEQQEWGIAAALSGDEAMMAAYRSGDPYMAFAIQAGAAPREATKATHGHVRRLFKATVLAVQYGMGERALAEQLGVQPAEAKELLTLHRRTYRKFWAFSDAVVEYAMLHHELWTTFGWRIHVGADANVRALRNFPMQANGAEMLRLACCLVTERGVKLCAPVHDALLIEAPVVEIDEAVASTREAMAEASGIVLGGFQLRTDVMRVVHPDRYMDKRGQKMWDKVWNIIAKSKS